MVATIFVTKLSCCGEL